MKYLYTTLFLFIFISTTLSGGKYSMIVFPTESKFIRDACLSAHGKVIVCTDNKGLKAFSTKDFSLLATFEGGHTGNVLCVDLSRDSSMLVSGGSDSTLVIWDFHSKAILQRLHFTNAKITTAKFSPDHQFILFGCSNAQAYLYNIAEHKTVANFREAQKDISSTAFSSSGDKIAIASGDKIIRIYNGNSFKLESLLRGHTSWVRSIVFYNNGEKLISCGDDGKLIRWFITKSSTIKKTILKTTYSWNLSVDIENTAIDNTNIIVYSTLNGNIVIKYGYGKYFTHLNYPVNKVLLNPNTSSIIETFAATLGNGLVYLKASEMNISDAKN